MSDALYQEYITHQIVLRTVSLRPPRDGNPHMGIRGGTGPGRGPGHGPVRRSSRVGPVGPVGPVGSVRSVRSGAKCANLARSGPGGAATTRPARLSRPEYHFFTKNMYLEHKPLKFSYPKSLCGVVGSPWVPLRTLVGFWESLIDFDKNSRIQVFIRSSWAS